MGTTLSTTATKMKVGKRIKTGSTQSDITHNTNSMHFSRGPNSIFATQTEYVYVKRNIHNIHMYLCRQRIVQIEPDIRHFQGLKVLQICCNYLQVLPDELSQLHSLTVLFVARNKLHTLPSSLYKLKYLKELNVSGNMLTDIPTSYMLMKSLETLDMSANPMCMLPCVIPYIATLRTLVFDRTDIHYLPPSIFRLVFLAELTIPETKNIHTVIQTETKGRKECTARGGGTNACNANGVQSSYMQHSVYGTMQVQNCIVLTKLTCDTLFDKACQKIITHTRILSKNTPLPVLRAIRQVTECDVCGMPLFTPAVILFVHTALFNKHVYIKYVLCSQHNINYSTAHESLRRCMFAQKKYAGDTIVSNIPFLFNTVLHSREQRRIVHKYKRHIADRNMHTTHLLLLEELIRHKGG